MDDRKKKVIVTIVLVLLMGILIFFLVQKGKTAEFECKDCTEMQECRSQCNNYCIKSFLFYVETNAQDNGTIQCQCTCKNPLSALKGK